MSAKVSVRRANAAKRIIAAAKDDGQRTEYEKKAKRAKKRFEENDEPDFVKPKMMTPVPYEIRKFIDKSKGRKIIPQDELDDYDANFTKDGKFRKGHQVRGGGRKKGTPNNFTTKIRKSFLDAFDELGGTDGLVAWASAWNENLTEFYKILSRLVPKDVRITEGGDVAPNYLENVKESELDAIIRSCMGRIK